MLSKFLEQVKFLFLSLFPGATVSNGCDYQVKLKPVEVFYSGDKYETYMDQEISQVGYPQYKINWFTGDRDNGFIVINAERGAGVDLFLSLELVKKQDSADHLIYLDQRKKVASCFGDKLVDQLFEKAKIIPKCVANSFIIRGLFSVYNISEKCSSQKIPKDCVVVSHPSSKYHGSLAFHPASSPCVNINYDQKSSIILLFTSHAIKATDAILAARSTTVFKNLNHLSEFLNEKCPGAKFCQDVAEQIIF